MSRAPSDIVQLKLRFKEALRQRLEESAAASGHSLNSEIVDRLERSFREDDILGGGEQARIVQVILRVMERVTAKMGAGWYEDHDAWTVVKGSVAYVLDEVEPPSFGSPALPDDEGVLAAVAAWEEAEGEWRERGAELARKITELAIRKQGHGLTPAEESEMSKLIQANHEHSRQVEPEPDLNPEWLKVWRQSRDRKRRIEDAYSSVVAIVRTYLGRQQHAET